MARGRLTALAAIFGIVCAACSGDAELDTDVAVDVDSPEVSSDDTASEPDGGSEEDGVGQIVGDKDASVLDGQGPEPGSDVGSASDVEGDSESDLDGADTPLCEEASCDDGLSCTTDACDPATGACSWSLQPSQCLVGGVCYAADAVNPNDPCSRCNPAAAPHAWTASAPGDTCDDGDACTGDDVCEVEGCVGGALTCDDGDPCTVDMCVEAVGCAFEVQDDGASCDDGEPCTTADVCMAGLCAGAPTVCDDGDPCTDEVCEDGAGCVASFNQAPCDDGAPCTDGDHCQDGGCLSGADTNCDDDDLCTIDLCDAQAGCVHLPTQNACCAGDTPTCDDGNPCTTATCDETTAGCVEVPNTAACDDGNACTVGDVCGEGACSGAAVECDDGNPCTDDLCSPADGCLHVPQDGLPCDDQVECTTDDTCSAGVCAGDDSACTCSPTFYDAAKATFVEMGATGNPGDGLDLDDDASTCTPEGECSEGIDNSLSILAGIANPGIADAVSEGELNFIMELRSLGDGAYLLAAYTGGLAPSNADCEYQTVACDWWIADSMLDDEECMPIASLAATLNGTTLTGGGVGTVLPFTLPLGDSNLVVELTNLRFEGDLTFEGDEVVSFDGVFGGAVPKIALESAINSVPDEDLPLPKSAIIGFMGLLENDIDTDGDGTKDALSMGLKVSGIDAVITGAD